MTARWNDPLARRRQRRRDEFERACAEMAGYRLVLRERHRFERACAEMAARGYSWRLIAERTGATPDECRHAARCYERRSQRG